MHGTGSRPWPRAFQEAGTMASGSSVRARGQLFPASVETFCCCFLSYCVFSKLSFPVPVDPGAGYKHMH